MTAVNSQEPLTIAYVAPSWPPGHGAPNGIVTSLSNNVPAMRARGHRAIVVAIKLGDAGGDPDAVEAGDAGRSSAARLEGRILGRLGHPAAASRRRANMLIPVLKALHEREGLDLIEIEESFGTPEAISRAVGVPVVVRLRGPWYSALRDEGITDPSAQDRYRVAAEGRGFHAAAGVTSPSSRTLDDMIKEYGAPSCPTLTIPNAAARPVPQDVEAEPGSVLFVGRMDRRKGADIAIQAVAKLAAEGRGPKLVLAGPDGGMEHEGRVIPIAAYIEATVPEAHRALFTAIGRQSPAEVRALRARHPIALVTSRYENYPNVVAEAMAYGQAVVASDSFGIQEMIQHNETGLMAPVGDVEATAAALGRLLADDAERARIGAAAAVWARDAISADALAARSEAFYRDVLRAAR